MADPIRRCVFLLVVYLIAPIPISAEKATELADRPGLTVFERQKSY